MALPRFTSRPSDSKMMRLPSGNSISSTCGLMLSHFRFFSARDLDLVVEVADVADDGAVLHRAHVLDGDDVLVAGGGDEDVGARRRVFHRHDLVAFHRRLQRADRIDLGHQHAAAGLAQRGRRALADVAEARDHRDLAGHHHVGAAADAVDQRLAAAIEIVELRLGDESLTLMAGHSSVPLLLHLVEAMHAGGGLLGDALDVLGALGEVALRLFLQLLLDQREEHFLFLGSRACRGTWCRRSRRAAPRCTSSVASPPSSRIMFGVPPSCHSNILAV